jgi:predicted secreted protein
MGTENDENFKATASDVTYDTKGAVNYPPQSAYDNFTTNETAEYAYFVRTNTLGETDLYLLRQSNAGSFVISLNYGNDISVSVDGGGWWYYLRPDGTSSNSSSSASFSHEGDTTPPYGTYDINAVVVTEPEDTNNPKEAKNMPIVAMGTVLRKADTPIANLTSIDGVSVSSDTIETTNLSTEGGYRTFVTSLKDAGDVGISGHFEYASHNALLTDFEDGSGDTYTIEFPDGTAWTFTAVVTAFSTSAELEDLISFDATLKVSGRPTLIAPTTTI